ncbi:MAG: GFA family protein [Myxococcota bacterium]
MPTTGGCFCGRITYEVTGELQPASWCHCSMCRKRFGGAGCTLAPVRAGEFREESASQLAEGSRHQEFRWTAGAEALTRFGEEWGLGFCSICGSTLVGFRNDDVLGVTLSTLDGDPEVRILQHLFVGSKPRWHLIGDDAPQHDTWPG